MRELTEGERGDALAEALRECQDSFSDVEAAATRLDASRRAIRQLVNEQAEDDGLWFVAQTAPEAYLQQELRRLHAAIEA